MDSQTLLTVGFGVLVAATLFVTAHAGAVAVGLLPAGRGADDTDPKNRASDASKSVETGESVSADGDDTGRSRITAADRERIRNHLEKDRYHRRPDDLLPSDDDGS